MVSAFNVTTKRDFVLPLQYVSEGDTVATPANFGVVPSTPTYTAAGRVTEIQLSPEIVNSAVQVLGDEDLFDSVKNEELYTFNVISQIYDTTLLKYGIDAANGVGTIDESLTFKFSRQLNGTEYYVQMKGCRASSTSLSLAQGIWEMSQTWVAQAVTVTDTTDPDVGATNVTSIPTNAVWEHNDTGSSPFLWNATNYGERSFTLNVTRDLATLKVNGSSTITYTKASNRNITATVDVIRKDNTLYTDMINHTKRTASYELNDGTGQINFTDARITDWDERGTATDTDIMIEPITITAENIAVVDS